MAVRSSTLAEVELGEIVSVSQRFADRSIRNRWAIAVELAGLDEGSEGNRGLYFFAPQDDDVSELVLGIDWPVLATGEKVSVSFDENSVGALDAQGWPDVCTNDPSLFVSREIGHFFRTAERSSTGVGFSQPLLVTLDGVLHRHNAIDQTQRIYKIDNWQWRPASTQDVVFRPSWTE